MAGIVGAAIYFFTFLPTRIDRQLNPVRQHTAYGVSETAQTLHDTLYIADLHTDTLLWRRDPLKQHDYGHVDIPRLRQGGVELQVFSAVTKSPRGLNFDYNDAKASDDITRLAKIQLWPRRTWNSIYERAVFQAERLHRLARQNKHHIQIARTKADLVVPPNTLVAILLTEGAHPLEGRLENIDRLYKHGYRIMGLQHFFDNQLGGSMHGLSKAGLTEFGRQAVHAMVDRNIIIDVAHSSEAVVREVLNLTDKPLMISHGGITSHCPRTANRNLPDDVLKIMAARQSLIGIGYFEGVICDISPQGIAEALIYAVDLLGEDIIALGSDFDGTVETALDTSELAAITHALLQGGMEATVIRKVMGENARRFLTQNLPDP